MPLSHALFKFTFIVLQDGFAAPEDAEDVPPPPEEEEEY